MTAVEATVLFPPITGRLELQEKPGAAAGVNYIALSESGHSRPDAPEFLFGPFEKPLADAYYGDVYFWTSGCYIAQNIDLFGEWMLRRGEDALLVANMHLVAPPIDEYVRISTLKPPVPRQIVHVEEAVYLLHPNFPVFGHLLIDVLPKLYVLHKLGYDIDRLKYFVPKNLPNFYYRWFAALGIPQSNFVVFDAQEDIPRAGTLLMPTVLRTWHRVSPEFQPAVAFLNERLDAHGDIPQTSPAGSKVFISRGMIPFSRELKNRTEIESISAEAGFSIVHPETMSPSEQVAVFRNAKHIIGEYGSALHGVMFSKPGTICTALRSASTGYPGFVHTGICEGLGMRNGYVFGDEGPDASFTIEENVFRSYLKSAI